MKSQTGYCSTLVRQRDRDRYWCALLAPAKVRDDLFALYAFNCEIAEIGLSVSEPLIGQMRLRWWFDHLPAIWQGNPPQHPVAVALSAVADRGGLSRAHLETYLEARQRDMDDAPFQTLAELTDYAAGTSSSLLDMALPLAGVSSPRLAQMARSIGIAWGILGLVRSIPYHLNRGRILMPLDLCGSCQFDRQSMLDHGYRGAPPKGFTEVVGALTATIECHLDDAVGGAPPGPAPYAAPLLLHTLARGYLDELATAGSDPFQLPSWRKGPRLRDMLRLKWAALSKRL